MVKTKMPRAPKERRKPDQLVDNAMRAHFLVLRTHGRTATARTAEEFYGFRAKDVIEMHYQKTGSGRGLWFRLRNGRVTNAAGTGIRNVDRPAGLLYEKAMNIKLEACVAQLQTTADELATAGADHETIAMALIEVMAQLADEDRIGAEMFLWGLSELLQKKIEDAGAQGDLYEIKRFMAARQKAKPKARRKPRKKK